jgi:hypothetical protein
MWQAIVKCKIVRTVEKCTEVYEGRARNSAKRSVRKSGFHTDLKFILNAAFDKRVSIPGIAARPNEMSKGMDIH